jgi:hypothetical protein
MMMKKQASRTGGPIESTYTLKGVILFSGMDGVGLNAKLFCDGKHVGDILDEGNGGMVRFDFRGEGEEERFTVFVRRWWDETGQEEQYRKDFGHSSRKDPTRINYMMDVWTNSWIEKDELDRLAKKKTLVRFKGDPEGEWRKCNGPCTPQLAKAIRLQYGKRVEAIYGF